MLLLRACRRKTCELKVLSRSFLSLSKNCHFSKENVKKLSKISYSPTRVDSFKAFRFYLSTDSTYTNGISDPSDAEFPYVEHPDTANLSEEEVEQYRTTKNITIKGNDVPKPITQFGELCLPGVLSEILREENYSEPTPIQAQGWPVALSGRDLVGVSQTGSGKTLAYMLPAIVHATNANSKTRRTQSYNIPSPKILVLGPTRELVQQILQVSKRFIEVSHLKGACAYGGASRIPQLRNLQRAEICVATPGRLLDYLENRETSLKSCSYLVLDEADRMLDMGFEPQIREIINHIPDGRQTLMWSATWPKEIRNLAGDFLKNYIHITVGDTELVANPNIQQHIHVMQEGEKFEKFISLLNAILETGQSKVLVFAETKRKVGYLTGLLKDEGIKAWGIHGDCTQNQRDYILNNFRVTTPSVLIATDIASRGLDISDIHHVVNYDFPTNIEDYIHRIGRTARGSACGESHSFFTPENSNVLQDLLLVLEKANQEINPDLKSLMQSTMNNFHKPQRRYVYNRSYGNYSSNYNRNREGYGDRSREGYGDGSRGSYGDRSRGGYGNSRTYNNDQKSYGRDKRTYGIV